MKRKITVTVFTIIVAAAVIAGGTMSWFTGSAGTNEAVFTAGTVSIEAGQVINFSDEGNGGYEWQEGIVKAKRVVDYNCVPPVDDARTTPEAVLDLETGQNNDSNFFSLGFGGHVTVEFDSIIVPGDSIVVVVEDTWGGTSYPLESADIYASMDGENWVKIGEADNKQNQAGDQYYNKITMTNALKYARYIKVKDTSKREDFAGISNADGFDVNAIYAEGAYRDRSMNWNPGDISLKTFEITNTGTKSIHLRGKFSGSWYEYDEAARAWKDWTPDPDLGVVTIALADSGWVDGGDGWFYYNGSIAGTYPDKAPSSVTLNIDVCLDGENTDNQYQGKRYILNGTFEAIQASNGASQAAGWAHIPSEALN